MANLADLTIGVGTNLSKFTAGMREIPKKGGEAVDGIVQKFKAMAPKLEAAAKAGAALAGAALVVGATEGLEREALGDKLAAQLRLSEADSKVAGKIAGGLYGDAYGESLEQVNDAVAGIVGGSLAELGDTAAVERLSRKALDAASAFDGDLTDGIARASALVESGLAGNADEAFDLIIASSQKVAPALRDELGDATKEYSKHFADLGISGTDALGLLSSASDQFTLDKTGDAIKELTIRATDMSTSTVEAFGKLAGIDVSGIDTSTEQGKQAMDALSTTASVMSGRLLAGGDEARGAFDQIVDGLLSIEDPTEQANTAIALFGTPIEDLGTTKIPDFLASLDDMGGGLGDVAGRADELGETLNDNGKVRIEGYKRRFEGMLAEVTNAPGILGDAAVAIGGIGTVLAPLGPAIGVAGVVFKDQLSSMASAAGRSLGRMVKAVAKGSAKMVATIVRTSAKMLASIVRTSAKMVASMAKATAAMARTVVVEGAKMAASVVRTSAMFVAKYAFMAAQAALNAVKIAASWVIAMGPIAIAIALVVGLVAVIVKNWDTIKAATGKVWDWISEKTSAVFGAIVDVITSVWDRITGAIRSAQETVKSIIGTAWDFVVGAVKRYVDLLLTIYVKIPQRIVSALGNLATLLVQKGKDTINGLRDGITTAWDTLVKWVVGVRALIVKKIGDFGRLLLGAGKALMEGLLEGIRKGWEKVTGFVGGMADGIRNLKGPIPYDRTVLVDNGLALMFGLERGMQEGMRGVLATAGGIAGQIEGAIRPGGTIGLSVAAEGSASSSSGRGGGGGLVIEHAEFGDRSVVRDLDLWARSRTAGV